MGAAEKLQEHFTYGDYAKWPEDERWELIDGVARIWIKNAASTSGMG